MICFKIDVLETLKNAGYSTYKIRNQNIFGQATLQEFKRERPALTFETLSKLCALLNMQPGDLLEYKPDKPGE